jgi:hypothetical protein
MPSPVGRKDSSQGRKPWDMRADERLKVPSGTTENNYAIVPPAGGTVDNPVIHSLPSGRKDSSQGRKPLEKSGQEPIKSPVRDDRKDIGYYLLIPGK